MDCQLSSKYQNYHNHFQPSGDITANYVGMYLTISKVNKCNSPIGYVLNHCSTVSRSCSIRFMYVCTEVKYSLIRKLVHDDRHAKRDPPQCLRILRLLLDLELTSRVAFRPCGWVKENTPSPPPPSTIITGSEIKIPTF